MLFVAKLAAREANINLPNLLTFSRLLLIPIFVLLFSQPTPDRSMAAAAVFGIAAITDLLDGYWQLEGESLIGRCWIRDKLVRVPRSLPGGI